MTCFDYHELLSAYLDRALPPHEQRSVASHLESCEVCRTDLTAFLNVKEALRGQTMPPIPTDLIAAIEAQTVLQPPRWAWAESFWRWGPLVAGSLALTIWAFAIFQNVRLQMQQPRIPLQALLAERQGGHWSLNDDRRVAVYHATETESPPENSDTTSDASPQP